MGNITQLKQGSLNGLRRQINECLDRAYNKGYEDGAKEQDEVQYQNGYKVGQEDGYSKGIADRKDALFTEEEVNDIANKERQYGYNQGLEDGYQGYRYLNQWFCNTCFAFDESSLFPEYKRREADTCCLEDIIADVGFTEVLNRVKAYEEKKKAEEEIKVGDEIQFDNEEKGIVIVSLNLDWHRIMKQNGFVVTCNKDDFKKTGRNFSAEVSQLLDKLKGNLGEQE